MPIELRIIILEKVKRDNPGISGDLLWEEAEKEVEYVNKLFSAFFGGIVKDN